MAFSRRAALAVFAVEVLFLPAWGARAPFVVGRRPPLRVALACRSLVPCFRLRPGLVAVSVVVGARFVPWSVVGVVAAPAASVAVRAVFAVEVRAAAVVGVAVGAC